MGTWAIINLAVFRAAGRGGGVMGWVIRIIFDPNTRHWGGGGFEGGIPWITLDHSWTILDHFAHCTFKRCVNGLVDLWIIFRKLN